MASCYGADERRGDQHARAAGAERERVSVPDEGAEREARRAGGPAEAGYPGGDERAEVVVLRYHARGRAGPADAGRAAPDQPAARRGGRQPGGVGVAGRDSGADGERRGSSADAVDPKRAATRAGVGG